MFLARIVTTSKSLDVPFYIEVTPNFNDDGIRTLVIGKKRAVELFGAENIHVLDRDINEHVSWTYAKNERRAEYEEDLHKFVSSVTKKLVSSVKYYFVNIFTEKYSFFKKLIKWVDGKADKSVYITDNHIYIYGGKDVIGLSTSDFEYAGIDSDKVVRKIKDNPHNFVFSEDGFMDEKLRKSVLNNNIVLPYIHFISR